MIKTNIALSILILILTFSCDKSTEIIQKESCDYAICEVGRANTDTLSHVYGIFRSNAEASYIEWTRGGYAPDTLFISCFDPVIQLPSDGDYVKCSGFVKEVCSSEDPMIQKDSLSITQIEVLEPEQLTDCSTGFVFDTLEVEEIDKSLKVLSMAIDKHCLSILVSYTGGCEAIPEFTLNIGGDILFGGGPTLETALQGLIVDDCEDEKITLLKFNLHELGELIPIREDESFVLWFFAQDYHRVVYPHTYQ
jgi:hypothetical protein